VVNGALAAISPPSCVDRAAARMRVGSGLLETSRMATMVQPVEVSAAKPSESISILRKIFSFPAMLGAMLVGGIFVPLLSFHLDPDVWWHIRVGETILETHHWPTTDPYSFTAFGTPWIAYEWLGEVLMATAARLGGLRGLFVLNFAMAAAVLLALYVLATIRSGNSKSGFLTAVILFVLTAVTFSARPLMLGYLFLILTLICLERFRQGKTGALWLLPPLFLIWVNTHGSFIVGLGVIAIYWLCGLKEFTIGGLEARRWPPAQRVRLELVFLLSLVATAITPYGTRLAFYPFDMAFNQPLNVASIDEWQPIPFNFFFAKLFLVLVIGLLFGQAALRFKWRLEEFVLVLIGIASACLHSRFIILFVAFAAPLLAVIIARWMPRYDRAKDQFIANFVIMALVAAGIFHYFPSRSNLQQTITNTYPVGAVEYVRAHSVPGPMLNTYFFGGYLVDAFGPQARVFIDGRADLYERSGVFADYLKITNLKPGTLKLLDNYQIQSCLIEADEPLATLLAAAPGWQKVYEDKVSVLYVRKQPAAPASSARGSLSPTATTSSISR
jgi:hypothetical protein